MRKKEQVKKKDEKNKEKEMETKKRERNGKKKKMERRENGKKKEWKVFSSKSLPFDPSWIRNNFANLDRQMERSDKS